MNSVLEIFIIVLAGTGSAAFIVWYFFFASRRHKCNSCAACREEIMEKIKAMESAETDR